MRPLAVGVAALILALLALGCAAETSRPVEVDVPERPGHFIV